MSMQRSLVICAVAMLVSADAWAQPSTPRVSPAGYTEAVVQGGVVVEFPDDVGRGDAPNPWGDVVRRPPGVLRAGLVRPRMNFVPELLKSVENL